MYYIVYPIFYLLSLLPWRVMYFISDAIYGLIYYVLGYRKDVVMKNLLIAFPEKTEKERIRIAKDFYHNLIDTFIEVIKLISISEKELRKRFTSNIDLANSYYDKGKNLTLECGHFFSWEFINLGFCLNSRFPFVAVYMKVSNKVIDKIMYDIRGRYGAILVPAVNFKENLKKQRTERYAMGLAADQNPGKPQSAYWVPFFNRLTPFVTGPEKGARADNNVILFGDFHQVKRGHYHLQFSVITETPRDFEEGQLTKIFAQQVERVVRERPSNYLWSHRRWKWEFDEEKYGHLVVK